MPDGGTSELRFSAPPDDLDTVQDFVEDALNGEPVEGDDRMAFETALAELVSNVIQHADGGRGVTAVLTVTVDEDRMTATISDSAEDGGVVLADRSMPEGLAESGRGIALIQALVDDLEFDRSDGRNVWRIVRHRRHGSEDLATE